MFWIKIDLVAIIWYEFTYLLTRMSQTSLVKIIDETIGKLSQKQQKILLDRFGLKNGKGQTLQKIGNDLNITRERVRQIIEQAMKEVRNGVRAVGASILEVAEAHLRNAGGIRRDDYFLNDLKYKFLIERNEKYADERLRFILFAGKTLRYQKEDENNYSFWCSGDVEYNEFLDFEKRLVNFLRESDRRVVLKDRTYLGEFKTLRDCHFAVISKIVGMNVFGELGLREWPEIEPKTIRDKIYLALKRCEKPMHFEDIAKQIARFGIDRRGVHVQTVHNELIKDSRFVLVGRGIYALEENGYQSGTVREVIVRLMKNHGPLSVLDVVKKVNEKRFFKENTILLNLQNRKYFRRLEDGRYHTKEA